MHMLKHVPVLPLDRGLCIPMVLAETVAGMSEGPPTTPGPAPPHRGRSPWPLRPPRRGREPPGSLSAPDEPGRAPDGPRADQGQMLRR